MGILSDGHKRFQQWRGFEPTSEQINSKRDTKQFKWSSGRKRRDRNSNKFVRFLRLFTNELHDNKSRQSLSIHSKLSSSSMTNQTIIQRVTQIQSCHRHNFNVYTISTLVLSLLSPTVALAENVGGVSATSPIQ